MITGGENSIFGDLMHKHDEALLSTPRRTKGRALLPDNALGLTGLSLASGGLGYRFWRSNTYCAFLASSMHTSYHFPELFPALAHLFPLILELVPAQGMPPPRASSTAAALAARVLVWITAAAPLVPPGIGGKRQS